MSLNFENLFLKMVFFESCLFDYLSQYRIGLDEFSTLQFEKLIVLTAFLKKV